jgi:hypothetical protein
MSDLAIRIRTKNEATGMRVVAQYVQEFWECGWQPFATLEETKPQTLTKSL